MPLMSQLRLKQSHLRLHCNQTNTINEAAIAIVMRTQHNLQKSLYYNCNCDCGSQFKSMIAMTMWL